MVAKKLNIDVVDTEIHRQKQYEQKDKTTHLVRHAWHGLAEDEGHCHCYCDASDNSEDGYHTFLDKG